MPVGWIARRRRWPSESSPSLPGVTATSHRPTERRGLGPEVGQTVWILLERESDLDELGRIIDGALRGHGRVVLVEGDAGIGKTRLLQAACEIAAGRGFTCLRARAGELEHGFAFGCVRQLLEPTVRRASRPERERLFAGAAALSQPLFAPVDASEVSPADTSFSMLLGLYWLLDNIADAGPLVLSIDDLQWADPESSRFVQYVAPRIDGLPLVLIASVRTPDKGLADVARLAVSPETTVLRPRPLGMAGTARLCRDRLGADVTDDFAAACWEATGGNPFYLELLLRQASDEQVSTNTAGAARVRRMGPPAVAHAVLLRLSEAPAAAGALVRAVAVLGDGAGLAEAAALAGISEDEAARAADLLTAHQILTPGDGLAFAHPIVREAVYADIGPRRRAEAHGRAASVLAERGVSEERIAAQIVEAKPEGDAGRVELLRRVAGRALGRGAPATAVALLRRALAEGVPSASASQLLLDLGQAELRIAAPEALDHLAAAVSELDEPRLRATSARLLAGALSWAGQSDRAVEALESAIEAVEPADPELALFLEADLAAHAQEASLEVRAPAAKRLERRAALPGATAGERLVLASLAFERARASESHDDAVAHLEQALAGGRLLEEQELDVPPSIYTLVVGLLGTEAVDTTDAVLDRMLADGRAIVSVPAIAFVLAHQGVAFMRRGAVARAEANARAALDLLGSHGIPLGVELALAVLVEALVESGELDAADRALVDGGFAGHIRPGMPTNSLLEARALLRFAQSRADEALADLVEFGRRDELWGGTSPLASRWRSRASLVLAARGELDEARRMALDDLERAERWGAPGGIGVARRAVALVEDGAPSLEGLEAAADVLAASPARLEHARALTDLGAALRRDNRRRDARRVLGEALRAAERCHASALAARARIELRAAGGRSSTPFGAGAQQLTASERRVAELAAEGHSNPEIAQALFVTRKTVETHLGSVYRKLAITGRGRLREALADPA